MMAKGAAARGKAGPKRDRIGGVRWYWWHSCKQQSGKADEAATAGDSIHGAAYNASEK